MVSPRIRSCDSGGFFHFDAPFYYDMHLSLVITDFVGHAADCLDRRFCHTSGKGLATALLQVVTIPISDERSL